MLEIGVQTQNVVNDEAPLEGFRLLRDAGFTRADFSLNTYLSNKTLYQEKRNDFFDRTVADLEVFFRPHKKAADACGIRVGQMHMPYPNYVPGASEELNDYLWNVVAPKSLKICAFFDCPFLVVHGFKLARNLGSEEAEWAKTEEFLNFLAPMAKEMGITICVENLYTQIGVRIVEGPCCDAAKAAERIDRMNERHRAEVLGFCFDTGHANLAGLDFEKFLVTLGGRLKALHIHDNDGMGDLHQIPFTFTRTRENTSSTDWKGFVNGLRRISFDKTLSFETAPVLTAFPGTMKREVLSLLEKIGEYFRSKCEDK